MNKLLGSYKQLYDILNIISFFVLLLFNLSQIKHKKLILSHISQLVKKYFEKNNKIKYKDILTSNTFWGIIETVLVSCIQYLPITFLNFKFGELLGTGANYFGLLLFIPYILFLFCFLLKIDPIKQIDLITPAFPLALTISKLACFFAGCCRGIEISFGLYNYNSGLVELPIQLLESIIAFSIFIFLMFYRKKSKPGTLFPIYLILYSSTRFFSEFLRCEQNILLGLKKYHFLCIIGIIFGTIQLFIVNRFSDKIKKLCNYKVSKDF